MTCSKPYGSLQVMDVTCSKQCGSLQVTSITLDKSYGLLQVTSMTCSKPHGSLQVTSMTCSKPTCRMFPMCLAFLDLQSSPSNQGFPIILTLAKKGLKNSFEKSMII